MPAINFLPTEKKNFKSSAVSAVESEMIASFTKISFVA